MDLSLNILKKKQYLKDQDVYILRPLVENPFVYLRLKGKITDIWTGYEIVGYYWKLTGMMEHDQDFLIDHVHYSKFRGEKNGRSQMIKMRVHDLMHGDDFDGRLKKRYNDCTFYSPCIHVFETLEEMNDAYDELHKMSRSLLKDHLVLLNKRIKER